MKRYISSILKIGLVNSGMFDLLKLNLDVKAIHLIGANNVGKTSLISLIQFLYFHDIRGMTFSKSSAETMAFYFRPEGSYILFEVRTIAGPIRTVGIFGKGTSDSRNIFVFDGSFELDDFLDDKKIPMDIQDVQSKFFERGFRRFKKFDDYEKALLGLSPEAEYNVQLFDLTKANFRLLRKLMQGLLKLDRLTSEDIKNFIIKIVEKGAVKTKINIATDFERKYRDIRRIQVRLDHLVLLKPIIDRWKKLIEKIKQTQKHISEFSERLFHLSSVYLELLEKRHRHHNTKYMEISNQLEALNKEIIGLTEQRADIKNKIATIENQKNEYKKNHDICCQFSKNQINLEKEILINSKVEINKILSEVKHENLERLRIHLTRRKAEVVKADIRLQQKSIDRLWVDTKFSETHRALLKFLLSENLLGLSASETVIDKDKFIFASMRAVDFLDENECFKGFGLVIPKSEWFVPESDTESPEEIKARIEKEIFDLELRIETAENREEKKQELEKISQLISSKDDILKQFNLLENFLAEYKSFESCEEVIKNLINDSEKISSTINHTETKRDNLYKKKERIHTDLAEIETAINIVKQKHAALEQHETKIPEIITNLPEIQLKAEYEIAEKKANTLQLSLEKYMSDLKEPESALEMSYEKESPDISFDSWIEKNLDIAAQIHRFEDQLHENYNNLITLVKGDMNKITQAFETVREHVAELNNGVKKVSISNIEQIQVSIRESDIVEAIKKTSQKQLDLFSFGKEKFSSEEARSLVDDYLSQIRKYGNEINLKDMFKLEFHIKFNHSEKPATTFEIHRFESHGTETGIKIVLYLGLIGLLQDKRKVFSARIPFFLDEVGSIDSSNLKQLIVYCTDNNFLPIFASPEIRKDIQHNFIFRREGSRSYLENEIIINEEALD